MSTGKSKAGRDELTTRVQKSLNLPTRKQSESVIHSVITALEETLLNNLVKDGFTLKLGSFGKFSIRHKPGIYRKIPFTGETKMTNAKQKVKFATLGKLREQEVVRPITTTSNQNAQTKTTAK